MKKRFLSFCMVLILCTAVAVPALAEGSDQYVWDEAGILTDEEYSMLEEKASRLSEKYDCGVYIHTAPEYGGASSVEELAENFYLNMGLGISEQNDGMMLTLSMAERRFRLLAYGDNGNRILTDYGRKKMQEEFVDDFQDDRWSDGFMDYLDQAEYYLQEDAEGHPFDVGTKTPGHAFKSYGIGFGSAAVVALITCFVFKSQMTTAMKQTSASAYVGEGGVTIKQRADRFTHTTTRRVRIKSDDDNRGSSGGTSRGSDGFSGSSGSF